MGDTLQFLLGLGLLAAGIGYGYGKFKEGRTKSQIDAITLLEKEQNSLKGEVGNLTKQLDEIKEMLKKKDKDLAQALAILQGRDPDTLLVMGMLKTYVEENRPFLNDVKTKVMPVIERLDKYLNKQSF